MDKDKIKIMVNGIEVEVDLNDKEMCEKYNLKYVKDGSCKVKSIRFSSVKNKIIALVPFLCLIAYLLIGFCENIWHPTWLIFLLIPLVPFMFAIFESRGKGLIILITILFSIVSYLCVGIFLSIWHPTWLVFFLIPIVSILVGGDK